MIYADMLNKPGPGIHSALERQRPLQPPGCPAVLYEKLFVFKDERSYTSR
jgi:hypothetical protein